jgi:hypothetical protein
VLYKELSEVERSFANLKDVIDMRPIYHQTDERVQAHIFVAAFAFLLHRAIEKKLKAARLDLSATEALRALQSVRIVDIDLGNGTIKRSVTRGTQRAASRAPRPRDHRPRSPQREFVKHWLVGVTLKPRRAGLPVRQPGVVIAMRHLDLWQTLFVEYFVLPDHLV